jgi:hypothetical protein
MVKQSKYKLKVVNLINDSNRELMERQIRDFQRGMASYMRAEEDYLNQTRIPLSSSRTF